MADYVLLRLDGGRPRLIVNWGSGPLLVQSLVEVSDGDWHSLEMVVEPSSASLFVDGHRFDMRAHYSDTNLLNLVTEFYVGAVPEEMTERRGSMLDSMRGGSRRGIVGCVDRVRVRGRPENWRTVFASSQHATTECVSDLFSCNGTSFTCPHTDSSHTQTHSVDDAGFFPNTTSVSVVEGGRSALSFALVEFISGRTFSEPDVRFRSTGSQPHGHLSIVDRPPDGDEIEFSTSDLVQSRVWYVHDGSETTSDSIRLYVANEEILLPVNIIPSNDAPVIRLPPNDTLTLVSNTKIKLNTELLSAVDPDDVGSSLEFSVYPSDDGDRDSGYFELAASSGVRAKITRFTLSDIEAGHMYYVHRGSASHSLLLEATDGKDASEVKRLTVVGLPLAVVPVINTGSSVPRGGNIVIGPAMLSFATNAPYLALNIRYQITEPPFYGELQKLVQYQANNQGSDNRMWTVCSSFTQTQLNESRVRYVHDHDATSREDYFLFRVSAVGAGQTAETDAEYHFRLTVVECSVDVEASQPVVVQTVDREQVITSGELRHVSSMQRHRPDDVIYHIRSPPRFGDLFVLRDRDRKWNQRRRKLTSDDRFTQADVDNSRLTYRMYTAIVAANDTIEFDVATSCASRRHVMLIQYRPATGNVRLINVGLTNVPEGGSAIIGPEMLNVEVIDNQEQHHFVFAVTDPPHHGVLQIVRTGSRNSAVSTNNVATFNAEDITSGRVTYVHDDSETRNDSFFFTVSETISGDVIPEPEVLFSDRFSINIALQNDNVPKRAKEATLDVVFGAGRRLGPEHLKYVDADIDTARLDFTWQADPEEVELVMTDDRWTPMYHFTQADVDSGGVYVHHYRGSENTVVIWLSDGLHFITDSLVIRASEPFVVAGNGTGLTVVAGQSAVVSAANVGFTTNIDVDPADIVFEVSSIKVTNRNFR